MCVVVATTVSLGRWQLGRAHEKEAAHARAVERSSQPPVDAERLAQEAAAPGVDPKSALEQRRVVARGEFLPASTIYLDNRTHDGVAGFDVVTALRLADGRAVPVDRGWIAANRSAPRVVPQVPVPSGVVTIEGRAVAHLPRFGRLPWGAATAGGALGGLWAEHDADAHARATGLAFVPYALLQTSDVPDGLVRDRAVPGSEAGKHWSYAAQWFGLAAAGVAWWIWFGVKRARTA